ncbi:hypothetical protein BDV59DRAFT_161077 [Aspergillus ambiguus]|uniref:uncharacterized protein n=1 Tax=Aspergillus ambiguus TaxID=176160 RepID=UPI003CCD768F
MQLRGRLSARHGGTIVCMDDEQLSRRLPSSSRRTGVGRGDGWGQRNKLHLLAANCGSLSFLVSSLCVYLDSVHEDAYSMYGRR